MPLISELKRFLGFQYIDGEETQPDASVMPSTLPLSFFCISFSFAELLFSNVNDSFQAQITI